MRVDKDRDIIIIGHPRSGSYWMQSCLPHFNCREAFNTVNFDIIGIQDNRFYLTDFFNRCMTKADEDIEIQKRTDWISRVNVPKCVKILTFQFQYAERKEYNQTIFDWVNDQNADVYWIKRKNKEASFRSLLIADATSRYVGEIPEQSVTVNLNRLPWLINSLSYDKDDYIKSQLSKEITHVYYEDLLLDPDFNKSLSTMKEQNSKDVVITNYSDVLEYLDKHGLTL